MAAISRHFKRSRKDHANNDTSSTSASANLLNQQPAVPRVACSDPYSQGIDTTIAPTDGISEPEEPVFDLDLLGIKESDREWFRTANIAIRDLLNRPGSKYNYQHLRRIMSNAANILENEKKHHQWARQVDPMVVWTACLVRVVGEERALRKEEMLDTMEKFLNSFYCPTSICRQAAFLADKIDAGADEDSTKLFAFKYPAFRIIEDAHRLDDLGAIGIINHMMWFGEDRRYQNLSPWDVKVFEEVFDAYPGTMKTDTGRKMAEERYKFMTEQFLTHWKLETDTSNV